MGEPASGTAPVEAVRGAEGGDAERCADLCRKGFDEAHGRRGGALLARREIDVVGTALLRPGGLLRLLADRTRLVLMGTLDAVAVGMLVGRAVDVRGAGLAVVEFCYVDPDARGVGVGRALLDGFVAWASERGCAGFDVPVLPGDRAAKQLLEAAGFSARLLVMHRTAR